MDDTYKDAQSAWDSYALDLGPSANEGTMQRHILEGAFKSGFAMGETNHLKIIEAEKNQ